MNTFLPCPVYLKNTIHLQLQQKHKPLLSYPSLLEEKVLSTTQSPLIWDYVLSWGKLMSKPFFLGLKALTPYGLLY